MTDSISENSSKSDDKSVSYIRLVDDGITEIKYIYHISDIHIKNTSRHDEYREVFERVYQTIRDRVKNKKSSIVVLTGDIMHTKTELSPEAVSIAAKLFKNLSEIIPVILIPGNHDMNLSNKNRMDALTPIVEDVGNLSNFYYLKKSGIYQYYNILFGFTSVIDDIFINASKIKKEHVKKIKQKNIFKIALYHGPVHGSELDVGFRMNREELTAKDFAGYDYGLLGDIHKFQFMDNDKRIAYAGSLIQQNHGESINGHGILLWDLIGSEAEFIPIKNNYGYCTVKIINGIMPDMSIPKNARIRFILEKTTNIAFDEILTKLKKKYNILEVVTESNHRSVVHLSPVAPNKSNSKKKVEPMTAFSTQKNIISDYLRANNIDDITRNNLIDLHQKIYQKILEKKKDGVADVHHLTNGTQKWKILELTFSNTLSYGENNHIDFRNYDKNKIIGIIAPNFHGKTAILDVILFCLFDRFSRGDRRDILNKDKNKMYCSILFSVGNNVYHIERIGTRSKNGLTVKIDVNFSKITLDKDGSEQKESLNGLDKNDTNKKITEIIGEYNDYILTAFSLNLVGRTSNFGDMTQLQKKEYLNDILKLNIFEDCHSYVREKVKKYSTEMKTIEQYIGTKSLDDLRANISEIHTSVKRLDKVIDHNNYLLVYLDEIIAQNNIDPINTYAELSEYKLDTIEKINETIADIKNYLSGIINNGDINNLLSDLSKSRAELSNAESTVDTLEADSDYAIQLSTRQKLLSKIEKIPSNRAEIKKVKEELSMKQSRLAEIKSTIQQIQSTDMEKSILIISKIKDRIQVLRSNYVIINKTNITPDKFDELVTRNVQLQELMQEYIDNNRTTTTITKEQRRRIKTILSVKKSVIYDLHKLNSQPDIIELINKYKMQCDNLLVRINTQENLFESYYLEWVQNEKNIAIYYDSIASEKCNSIINTKISSLESKLELYMKYQHQKEQLDSLIREQNVIEEQISRFEKDIEQELAIIKLIERNAEINKEIDELNVKMEKHLSKISAEKARIKDLKKLIRELENKIEENKSIIESTNTKKKHLQLLYNYRFEYENFQFKKQRYDNWNNLSVRIKKERDDAEKERIKYTSQMEIYKKELTEYMEHRSTYDKLSEKLTLYNTYVQTMNYNGLPYEILKKYLPLIEEDINHILHSMVDFSIEFVFYDENKLKELKEKNIKTNIGSVDINIVRHGRKPYNIQIVSGFEKFIIGLAIRMALMQISLTAKPNFFVIDEGWGAIDSEHINNIGSIMNFIKNQYDHVIIISHLEPLKNEVDYEINIDRRDGFSYLRKSHLKLTKKPKTKVVEI